MFNTGQELFVINMDGDYNCPVRFKKYIDKDYAYVEADSILLKIKVTRLVDRLEWNKNNPMSGPTYVLSKENKGEQK
jgi:hypothetical protein